MRCILVLLLLTRAYDAAGAVTALRFGQVIDGRGGVIRDGVVVVDGERVTGVGTVVPAGAKVVDLRPLTAIPGLLDMHTHMSFYWDRSPGTRPWTQLGTLSPAVTAFLAQENARKTLDCGVTTVRDLRSSARSRPAPLPTSLRWKAIRCRTCRASSAACAGS